MENATRSWLPAQGAGSQYQRVQIQTAEPMELILILYREALHCLEQAKTHLNAGNIQQRFSSIDRAMAMIGELQAALDCQGPGKEIAVSLDKLYTYLLARLTEANALRDRGKVDEVISILGQLHSAWEEASRVEAGEKPRLEAIHA